MLLRAPDGVPVPHRAGGRGAGRAHAPSAEPCAVLLICSRGRSSPRNTPCPAHCGVGSQHVAPANHSTRGDETHRDADHNTLTPLYFSPVHIADPSLLLHAQNINRAETLPLFTLQRAARGAWQGSTSSWRREGPDGSIHIFYLKDLWTQKLVFDGSQFQTKMIKQRKPVNAWRGQESRSAGGAEQVAGDPPSQPGSGKA